MNRFIICAMATFTFSTGAMAASSSQSAETLMQNSTVSPQADTSKTKLEKHDLDKEVTDIKLRATSGAKSTYSTSLSFTYAGASLSDPGGDVRPNVSNSAYSEPVSISGNLGFRYRFNKNQSLFGGTGFYQSTPFHNDKGTEDKMEVDTPQLAVNDTFATSNGTQVGQSVRAYLITRDYQREYGENFMLAYSVSAVNPIGQSRFDGGIRFDTWYTYHDKDTAVIQMGPTSQRMDIRGMQVDYGAAVVPTLQFNKRGTWNVYTSVNLLRYSHYRSDKAFSFDKGDVTQTLGGAVAVVRDVYVSPYVTFQPSDMTSDKTSVNLSASINL